MPPSPRLSARRINSAYLIEMIRISAHRISDTTPRTASGVSGAAMGGGLGGFLQRVEGAGADIAIDDAERADAWLLSGGGLGWPEAATGVAGHWLSPHMRRAEGQSDGHRSLRASREGRDHMPVCDEIAGKLPWDSLEQRS